MYVIKRDGKQESVSFDKITERILKLTQKNPPLLNVDYILIAQKTVAGIFPGVTTQQLDNLAAETAAYMSTIHPEYDCLASRLVISNLHKETCNNYEKLCEILLNNINPINNMKCPLISENVYKIAQKYNKEINNAINYERDFDYDFFGFKTLEKSYLIKIDKKVVERPQQMLMRVAIGIHADSSANCNINEVLETYDLMSRKFYTHATPTLYNAGTNLAQLASCFLLQMQNDSIDGIYSTLKQCALISKYAGGIGLSCHNIRARDSYIRGTNGSSSGIIPMLKVFNDTSRYVDQGGGKRKGSFAIYLEPWHFDIEDFLELKKNHGKEEMRCRDLFYGLWICDLFMKRVENNEEWSLFCPNECKGLSDCYGEEFEKLYIFYEISKKSRKIIKARELWDKIIISQIETGTPYMMYKDACNKKSNQQNLGTIKSSNLCSEIVEYVSPNEIAVCLTGDTKINTKNGIKNIADCNNEDILSYFDNDIDLNINIHYEKGKLISNGIQSVYKLTFAHDINYIKATENHLFLTLNTKENEDRIGNCYTYVNVIGYEWKRLKNLKINDKIVAIPFGNNKYNVKKDWRFIKDISYIGEEEVYDLSLENSHNFVANGYISHNCNLASIALPSCVNNNEKNKTTLFFDHQLLHDITYKVAKNLDKIIDVNYYPLKEAENSNKKHRPIGIGVQGLADVFLRLRLPFDSLEAKKLNKEIFETMYFAAASSSCDNAKINGTYISYENSPISKGILCPDMWDTKTSNRWNFDELRKKIEKYGVRNSLLIALMPTASTSQILGYNECFEPITTNIYSRRVLAGEFTVINKYLVKDLLELGIWSDSLKNKIIANQGSVQGIKEIPTDLQLLYRTVWELKMKDLMDMSIDRAPFIDQSQSFNAFISSPNKNNITSMHFYGWKAGLKTGMYYLRTRPATNAIQFTVDSEKIKKENDENIKIDDIMKCDEIICLSCGS